MTVVEEDEAPAGDPVCWLDRVCEACGALTDDRSATVCERCGAPLTVGRG